MSEQESGKPKKSLFSLIKDVFKEKPIPDIELSVLINNPEEFVDGGELKTSGFVQKVNRQKVSWPLMRLQPAGDNINIPFIDWITEVSDIYLLRPSQDRKKQALLVRIRNSNYSPGAPVEPQEENFDSNSSYTFRGKIEIVKLEDGSESIMFDAEKV